jgi:hypothetical protein
MRFVMRGIASPAVVTSARGSASDHRGGWHADNMPLPW